MLRKIIYLLLSSWVMLLSPISYAGTPVSADKIKAAYTFQFSKFTTWPNKDSYNDKHFTICMLGVEPIAKELELLNQYKTNGRSIIVRFLNKISNTNGCNILYIAKTEKNKLKVIFRSLRNKPILTVSSIADFALQGGMIGLVTIDNKIRLEINLATAKRVDIKLSAKLLEISDLIEGDKFIEEQP